MKLTLNQNPFESSKTQTPKRPSQQTIGLRRAFWVFLGGVLITAAYHGTISYALSYHQHHDSCRHKSAAECLDSIFGVHPTNSFYAMLLFAVMSSSAASIFWVNNLSNFTRFYLVSGAALSFIGINVGVAAFAHSFGLFMAH